MAIPVPAPTVRETPAALDPGPTVYRADYPRAYPPASRISPPAEAIIWKPGIHMPRALCRLVLEVTGVRVERLQDCSEGDAKAEGCGANEAEDACGNYRLLRDQINGAGAWEANPWVWEVEFRRDQR
ncbi:hypothetical protein [Cupriavidus sp. CP313]